MARHPSHGYVLGIECDAAAYHSDRSSRLRDVWRAQILRGRGWRLHRIWSTRWWYHRGEEIDALKLALEEASAHFEQKKIVAEQPASPEPQKTSAATTLESWQMTLDEWKQRCKELRNAMTRMPCEQLALVVLILAHRYRVELPLKEGKAVPEKVFDDYPNLSMPYNLKQQGLFDED